jgi:ABC-type phosphate transport system permease subunit
MSTVQLRVVGRAIAIIIIAVDAVQADQAVVADVTTITATLKNAFN